MFTVNDLPLLISAADADCDMFANESSLTAAGKCVVAINGKLQTCLQEVSDWDTANMMLLNPEKTKSMVKQLDKSISVLCLLLISC